MLQANLLALDHSPKNGLGNQAVDVLASCRKPNLQIQFESVREARRSYRAIAASSRRGRFHTFHSGRANNLSDGARAWTFSALVLA
jgi:hypothetical protein